MKQIEEYLARVKSYQQLVESGYNNHQIKKLLLQGTVRKIRQGVYVSTQFFDSLAPWEVPVVEVLAVHLNSPITVFSHQSAALLQHLDLISDPDSVHVYCSRNSRGSRDRVVNHPFLVPETPTFTTGAGILCTDIATTVADSATVLSFQEAVVLADSALRQKLITETELKEKLLGFSRRGRRKVLRVADSMSSSSESAGETLTRLILDDMGVSYIEQYWVPGYNFRVDFYLPDFGIYIEFDGAGKYKESQSFESSILQEKWREDDITANGKILIRTRWEQVFKNPAIFRGKLAQRIREVQRQKLVAA
ncbi:hypothetical protein [Rothia aerolata]|uniref:hypothetical protein n=1 Tax=Rothia aerolata TaxID=1812262 RepID=UPI00166310AB|nr:hypothetical protein [Rothia aerolata]